MTKKNWQVAFVFAVPWTLMILIIRVITIGHLSTVDLVIVPVIGVAAGAVFAKVMDTLAERLMKRNVITIDNNEKLIREGGANHFRNKESVGGKLVLTDRRLIFQSHKANIQNHKQYFHLDSIRNVGVAKTFNVVTNVLTVELPGNVIHKFIVEEPQEWANEIGALKNG